MRLRSLLPVLAALALAACDSTGALKVAQAPAAKPADNCCCKAATTAPACPPAASPAQPPAMAPEPERPAYRPAVHHAQGARREAVRRTAHVSRGDAQRDYGQVREYAYAQQRSYAAPAYDRYVEVPDQRLQGQVMIVEDESAYRGGYRETYSEQSDGYAFGGQRYAGGYESHGGRGCGGCGPREAAGLDRNGFLTWPGKVPARP